MKFAAKSEKEIQEENLLQPGIYDFEVTGAEDKTSKAGNDMIQLNIKVFGEGGRSVLVTDYLMEKLAFKLRHACDACGLLKQYESGELNSDMFYGKAGKVKLKIDQDKEGKYADKNAVQDYVKKESGVATAKEVEDSDSIPF